MSRWRTTVGLALLLGVPPLAVQLSLPVPRLGADAVEYYAHVRSLYFDHDVDFANEFEHFGIIERGDKIRPTVTGHRRTIFSVGPALLWLPFYAAGDLVARAAGDVQDGYSAWHIRATCIASLAYGVAGLLLIYSLLAASVQRAAAFWTVGLLLYATFLYWYMVHEAVMSHAPSFFMAALVLRIWWAGRAELSWPRATALGLTIGLAATVRWQNGVLLLLPALTLLETLRHRSASGRPAALGRALVQGPAILVAFALGALPQMLAWKAVFGQYLLDDPPHGSDFLRLDHPYLLETFFSSRHGLLYWTPVLWLAFLGFIPFIRRARRTALSLLLPLLIMTYVNVCSGDWWAGGSFSNRRFDSALPLLACGLAYALDALLTAVRRRPGRLLVAAAACLVLWNHLFMLQYRRNLIPRDDVVSFARVARNNAGLLAQAVGTPLAWPANWIFAWRHDLPVAQYDLAVGKYLFYRQNNLEGVIDLGDPAVDPALLDAGWTRLRPCGPGAVCRSVREHARVFAPLDVPETLDVAVHARGRGTLSMAVNRRPVAELPLANELQALRVRVPAELWRRELNEIAFHVAAPASATVDKLVFARRPR